MAKVLADRDIERLLGSAILDANKERINPNGIELCLGKHVHFLSTGEEMELGPGTFLKVSPGETVSIASLESLAFRSETVQTLFPKQMLTRVPQFVLLGRFFWRGKARKSLSRRSRLRANPM